MTSRFELKLKQLTRKEQTIINERVVCSVFIKVRVSCVLIVGVTAIIVATHNKNNIALSARRESPENFHFLSHISLVAMET